MENKYHITLVGSGMIGAGLAVNALMNGHPTIIYDGKSEENSAGCFGHYG